MFLLREQGIHHFDGRSFKCGHRKQAIMVSDIQFKAVR